MRYALALAALLLAGGGSAQGFPEPRTGSLEWERVGDVTPGALVFDIRDDGVVFARRGSQLHRFTPAAGGPPAGTWHQLPNGGGAEAVFVVRGDTLLSGHVGAIFRSTDAGLTWNYVNGSFSTPIQGGGPKDGDGFFEAPPGHPYAGCLFAGTRFWYSDDRGASWQQGSGATYPGGEGLIGAFVALPSGRILHGRRWGVGGTDDGGLTWTASPIFVPYRIEVQAVARLATPGSVESGTPDCGRADVSECEGVIAFGRDNQRYEPQVWRSNDGGRTWSEGVDVPDLPVGYLAGLPAGLAASEPDGARGLGQAVAILSTGLYYTTVDGGESWQIAGRMPLAPTPSGAAHAAALVRLGPDGHVWVTTFHPGPSPAWLYRSAEPIAAAYVVAGEAPPVERAEARIQVEPNPSSAQATVRLTLSTAARSATVQIYDALGRRVAVLHDGALVAGRHAFALDTAAIPAGIYTVIARVSPDGGSAWMTTARLTVAR